MFQNAAKSGSKKKMIGVLVLIVLIGAFWGYTSYQNTPKRFSQLCPEFIQADSCNITLIDENMDSHSMTLENKELETLLRHLDSFEFFPYPEGERDNDSFTLEGHTHWMFYFLIDGTGSPKTTFDMTEKGQLAVGGHTYQTPAEDFAPLPILLSGRWN